MLLCKGEKTFKRKIVLLGDGSSGKTSLLNVFARGYFPPVYEPTIVENYIHDIYIDSKHVELSVFDTAGQEEYGRLRSLTYDDAQVIMLCFSVDSRASLDNLDSKWADEIKRQELLNAELVVVALKCDLREEAEQQKPVSTPNPTEIVSPQTGEQVAKAIGAKLYLECSAKLDLGVKEVFTQAARLALDVKPRHPESAKTRGKNCIIL